MFTWVFVILPVLVVAVAWFIGKNISWNFSLLALIVWWGGWAGVIVMAYSEMVGIDAFVTIIISLFMLIFGPLIAVVFGIDNGTKTDPSPVAQAHRAYANLSPESKEKTHKILRMVAKMGISYASAKLKDGGRTTEAELLRKGSKFL